MNNKLDCNIVLDLLPSYVDGLTCRETNNAIASHIADCKSCADTLSKMREPVPAVKIPSVPEVDYLKKVRNHSVKVTALTTFCSVLLILLILFVKIFVIGTPVSINQIYFDVAVSAEHIITPQKYAVISGSITDSGRAVSRVKVTEQNGVISLKVYAVPVLLFKSGTFSENYQVQNDVWEIRLDGLTIWDAGTVITPKTLQLYNAKHPYIGDMPANANLANLLGLSDYLSYTSELQTADEPYGWKIIIDGVHFVDDNTIGFQRGFCKQSYLMLALIDNLGYVTWRFETNSGWKEYTVTAEMASDFIHSDIKSCNDSPTSLQKLIDKTNTW